ncbi:DUF6571 family protein [Actinomyces sp. MRS3W]|uniref:DUF6571 family protein n=1 Tax=Actinomyces sp. MRS3W TaxID=2800796 RepID=UPI0028FD1BA4|nr:DUF6571 family protein [Actinomyces sp. MRS3W]MDU0347434.1 DUF6571 family protein [Actinomyces sp. MRS3W]
MTKVYLDVEKLETAIEHIRNVADDAESARTAIDREFTAQGVDLPESNFSGDASTAIDNVNLRADEIESCKDEIVRLNESGIAGMNADGVITYDLPDTVTISSAQDFSSVVQAEIDADKAKNATGDELLELMNGSVADRRDDEVYAAAFADAMGPEAMADLAYRIDQQRQSLAETVPAYDPDDPDTDYVIRWQQANDAWLSAQATLSICFGTATSSSAWTPQHRSEYAEGLAELVTDESQPYYMPLGFNLLLEGAGRTAANTVEVDGEAVQAGGEFDKNFLLDLGYAMQEHEQSRDGLPIWQIQRMKTTSSEGTVGDWDPMAGILTAMGRQPAAALDFMAPPVDARATEETVEVDDGTLEWLKGRDWDSTSFEAFTAAFAGASEYRQKTPGTTDERAAWLTEQAVVDMAGRKSGLWTDVSRQNAAVVLANSMQEVDEAANGAVRSGESSEFNAYMPAGWEERNEEAIRSLLQETLKDDVALETVSDAAGRYTSLRLDSSLDALGEDASYADAFNQVSQTRYSDGRLLGYIQGAAEKGRGDAAAQQDGTNQMILDAFGKGLSLIPGPQSPLIGKAMGIAESYALDAAGDALPDYSQQAQDEAIDMQDEVKQRLLAEAYIKLEQRDLLPEGAYENKDGNPYVGYDRWMSPGDSVGQRIDAEALFSDPDNMAEFNGWIQDDSDLAGVSSGARDSGDGFDDGLNLGKR